MKLKTKQIISGASIVLFDIFAAILMYINLYLRGEIIRPFLEINKETLTDTKMEILANIIMSSINDGIVSTLYIAVFAAAVTLFGVLYTLNIKE
ncbi:hypothetical protein [Methanococcus maripaludis]|uniref:ABC-type multidrug transport system permease subunit n=1 Tax=Methanococcus maripaludis TaxID=39152 RepID=A0A7J9P7N1_METMI|nr:hypothetical protein [Methanococcus maripaludis]MBA2858716.1 ABC-type multidrug transport system permease subunit [Methanococcus maripaludis]MBM7408399.1 ABC-type multidrug transport system permease subunit [Methanococcus maripaludis]MBP2220069.1 ABC-type multidrug transport system permease subunit [Methanococcus maripaludis]